MNICLLRSAIAALVGTTTRACGSAELNLWETISGQFSVFNKFVHIKIATQSCTHDFLRRFISMMHRSAGHVSDRLFRIFDIVEEAHGEPYPLHRPEYRQRIIWKSNLGRSTPCAHDSIIWCDPNCL